MAADVDEESVLGELLEDLARALVDHPDAVKVEELEEDDGTVVKAVGSRENRRVLVDIVD